LKWRCWRPIRGHPLIDGFALTSPCVGFSDHGQRSALAPGGENTHKVVPAYFPEGSCIHRHPAWCEHEKTALSGRVRLV
jgi:hypothetical protein